MKQVMKTRMKAILAWVLAFAMTFANVDYVSATVVVESVEDAVVADVSVNDVSAGSVTENDLSDGNASGIDSSAGNVSTGDASGGVPVISVSESDVTASDVSQVFETNVYANTAIVSDTWNGMTWELTEDGALTISGNYVYETDSMEPWREEEYRNKIIEAVVTAQNVDDMFGWFENCTNLQTVDFSNFSTDRVEDMATMFRGCSGLKELDLSNFDTSRVTDMRYMFAGCSSLQRLNLSSFDTSSVTDMRDMFNGCSSLQTLDLKSFKTNNVVCMDYMFKDCSYLREISFSDFGASNVTSMYAMFQNCESLQKLDLKSFHTGNVEDMNFMFAGCKSLEELDVSKFNTSSVINMAEMFRDCNSLIKLDVSGFDTSNVAEMYFMFDGCYELTELDVSGFETKLITDMKRMFGDCRSLTKLDVSSFNTSRVNNMTGMFAGCSSLAELDVTNFDTDNVMRMTGMFYACSSLTELDVSNFDVSVASMEDMFSYCTGLERVKCFPNLYDMLELPHNVMYDIEGNSYETYFPRGLEYGIWLYKENPNTGDQLRVTEVAPQTYTGKSIKPQIRVYLGDMLLQEKADYTLSYKNNTKVNDASVEKKAPTIIVKGKGNFKKQDTVTFQILAKDLNDSDVKTTDIVKVKNNKVQKPVPTLTYNGKKLVNKKDFTVSYPDMSEENPDAYIVPGTYRILITGKGNFTGEKEISFTIIDGVLMSAVKIGAIKSQPYTSEEIKPEIEVTYKGKDLTPVTDYEVSYDKNIEVGTAIVSIIGKGTYVGTKTATFKITGTSIKKADVIGIEEKTYNGSEQTQNITVAFEGQEPLVAGRDYTVAYAKNINAGTATMTIAGAGGYTGSIKKTFKINKFDLSKATYLNCVSDDLMYVSEDKTFQAFYTKNSTTPKVTLVSVDGRTLTAGKDYTISHINNKKLADINSDKLPEIRIKGKGNYTGSFGFLYKIVRSDLESDKTGVTINVPDVIYSAKAGKFMSKPVLTDANGKKLVAGTDYEKDIEYYLMDGTKLDKTSVVESGQTVKVAVKGINNYEGTMVGTYRVTKASIKSAKVKIVAQVYTGKEITLDKADFESVKVSKDTITDAYGEAYEVVPGSYKNNLKKGTASVTIRGIGNYGGTKTVNFKIVAKEMIWFWKLFD